MSKLRISDAPLLPNVDGTEKIPTGGRGDYAVSIDQIKDHIFQDIGKELVGLGNVDNTSDLDKPVSTAQQAALNLKSDKTYVDTNLDLKADKTNVYTRTETTLALSQKADLVNGVVPENQIPNSFNDVLEFTTPNLPTVGESGKIYVTTDNNKTWRWGGNKYVEISGWNPDSVSKSVTLPTYYTKEAGVDPVTGVTDGAYFNVRSEDDDTGAVEYQNVGGVPTPSGKSYPSSNVINNIKTEQKAINYISMSVESVSDLRVLSGVKNGDTVRTLGHTVIGLGGGTYTFEAMSSKTDNNGSYIASSVASGTWVLISKLHIENFGVTTDKTDQAPRINVALDFAFKQGVRDIGFEKPNTYYYDTDIILEPRRLDWGNYPQNIYKFNWRFYGARLMPVSKETTGELYLCRDDINIHDLVMYGNSAKGTGSAYFDRCAINIGMPVSKDTYDSAIYRKYVSFTKFFNPAISHYRYAVKFHTDWSTYYNEFYSPQLFTVAYGYTTVPGASNTNQLTRTSWYAPKHVFGSCTFNLTNAETCHVFGGGSEFIYMPDVDGILPDQLPVAIYTADGTAQNFQSVYCTFNDYDIEQAYRAAILDGSMNNWTGRVYSRRDTSGSPIAFDNTFFTGKCLTYPTRQGGQANGMLSVENFASGVTRLYMKASKSSNATAAIDVAYVAELNASVSGINVGISGDSVSNPKFNVGNNMFLQTKAIAPNVSEFTGLEILGHNGGGLSKFSFGCHENTPILRAWNSSNGVVNLRVDATSITPMVDNTRSLGTASLKWATIYAGTGTINTSDERVKQQIRDLSEAEKRVAIKLKSQIKAFKFNDAVSEKGDKARIHFGVIAQEVKSAFESEGLVAEDYAVLCYDEWDAQDEIIESWDDEYAEFDEYDEMGEIMYRQGDLIRLSGSMVVQEKREAGNRYGVRYEELLAFIISAM